MSDRPVPLWLADWSDSEHEDFRAAWESAGVPARVLRSAPLGPTVGTVRHRLRSWPAYASLAARGLRYARGAPLVAWQPLAGAVAALLRRGAEPRLVVLNPLLDPGARGRKQELVLRGVGRAERVLFFSRAGLDAGSALGLDRSRLRFVPLGVVARGAGPPAPGGYLLAAGREGRDWETLARAAETAGVDVLVVGPRALPESARLRLLPQVDRERFLELLRSARALVVPLLRPERTAGQLAVLDAMALGRAVVATRAQGTEDYVRPDTGFLVAPGDAESLSAALVRIAEPGVAEALGGAALAAASGPFSLERFVRDVDAEATAT